MPCSKRSAVSNTFLLKGKLVENEELKRHAHTMVYDTLGREIHNNCVDLGLKSGVYHPETREAMLESNNLMSKLQRWMDPEEERNLFRHAKRELELLGEDEDFIENYLDIIRVFQTQGHSGGSAGVFIPTLLKLLNFENLTEITNDPIEWIEVGENFWQNTRNSKLFSQDGGLSYTSNDDVPAVKHQAKNVRD